jgi:signal transduction histidine kinase
MRSRSPFVLAIGFGILIILIAILGLGAIRRARSIYRDMKAAQDSYVEMEAFRRGMVNDMYLADILVRDYLLDPSRENAARHRDELLTIRDSLQKRVDQLSTRVSGSNSPRLQRLQDEVQGYWESMDPIFEWSAQDKSEQSWTFLRRKVLPRREAVVTLAREIAKTNDDNLQKERERLQQSQQVLETFLLRMMVSAVGIGIVVALLTSFRVAALEKKHQKQRAEIEETQKNLRNLSRQLVQAQEAERRALSRELHDEVGQMMTALGMELGNLEKLRKSDDNAFRSRLEDMKRLNADAMRAIRDLAMGLRPSMLDDLGLQAALQWQGREFSRHTGVPATIQVNGTLDCLTDAQSTCIYRLVQEALTNCARHAQAKKVLVSVRSDFDSVVVEVQDDGIGFTTGNSGHSGCGLLGIQERIEALDGRVQITSQPARGTTIRAQIPVAMGVPA